MRKGCDIIEQSGLKRSLLVFPGVGSPEQSKYAEVCKLMTEGAKNRGFDEIEVLYWPGQKAMHRGELSLNYAAEIARQKLIDWDKSNREYFIHARSFGTLVACTLLNEIRDLRLKRLILWGPPPFFILWDVFRRDFPHARLTAQEKGTWLSETFFESLIPIEVLLKMIQYKVIIATGQRDKYCCPSFLDYLRDITSTNMNLKFEKAVDGTEHEVTHADKEEVQAAYLQVIFPTDI